MRRALVAALLAALPALAAAAPPRGDEALLPGDGLAGGFARTGDPVRVSGKATQFLRRPIRFEAA